MFVYRGICRSMARSCVRGTWCRWATLSITAGCSSSRRPSFWPRSGATNIRSTRSPAQTDSTTSSHSRFVCSCVGHITSCVDMLADMAFVPAWASGRCSLHVTLRASLHSCCSTTLASGEMKTYHLFIKLDLWD